MNNPTVNSSILLLRRLRWTSLVEGATLILLVCLAVPMKRFAGMPEFVSMMGPLHGGAFLIYLVMVMRASKVGLFTAKEVMRLTLAAFIPFGALLLTGLFKRKLASISSP